MNNRRKIGLGAFCIVALAFIAIGVYRGVLIREELRMRSEGGRLVQLIDEFYEKENRLPEHSEMLQYESEYGIGPFYEKTTDSTYSISFCLGFDDYYMFDSRKNEWYYFP